MKREPQTDDLSTTSVSLIPVEPEHTPSPEQDGLTYPDVKRDKDGWPISHQQNDRPPLWK